MVENKFVEKNLVMDETGVKRTLTRVAHEIIEKNKGVEDIIFIGIRTRGVPIAEYIAEEVHRIEGIKVPVGVIDITLYRDDLSRLGYQPIVRQTVMPINIDDKKVILIDDVLYTGRTIRSALDAILDIGRPSAIQLAVLVDRGHRELPIRADYIGKNVPTSKKESVSVLLNSIDGEEKVVIKEKVE